MKKMNNLLTLKEFDSFSQDDLRSKCKNYAKTYKELEDIAKSDEGKNIISFSRNGKYLQVRNYVGIIQTKSGFTLEILPKIYMIENYEETKQIFIKLLKILYKLPDFKHIDVAKFNYQNMPLLEIFIEMFLIEIDFIIKKGIKSDYFTIEDNLRYLKGKLLVRENIKKNYVHKERFYVMYDEYNQNRPENRILKSALNYLSKISKLYNNIRKIRIYQEKMQNIQLSSNIDVDFKKIKANVRGMEHYRRALIWSKIFLKKDSFTSFKGKTVAFAILYPMERLFEAYVEHHLKNKCKYLTVESQFPKSNFVENLFGIRPDIVIRRKNDIVAVADSKWKIINPNNNDISQSDFYQLFAYKKMLTPKTLRLYYPANENFKKPNCYKFFDKTKISIVPLDLSDLIK